MDEAKMIAYAKEGDLDAFNRLVLAYQDTAYNLAYRMMGDPAAAEDVTQEAFIAAYRKLNTFRGGSFKAWMLRIVTNASYERTPAKRVQLPVSGDERLLGDVFSRSRIPHHPIS